MTETNDSADSGAVWGPNESPFDSMGTGGPAQRFVARALQIEHAETIRQVTESIDISTDWGIGTDIEETPPAFLGPLIRPRDAVMIVGKPGSGKSSLAANIVNGSYMGDEASALAGCWPIDTSYQWGRTMILNGETTSKGDWAGMLHRDLVGRGLSPKSEFGELLYNDRILWADPQLEGWNLNVADEHRTARALRLADELAKADVSMLVMDPVFIIFGAAENADNEWVIHGLNPLVKALKERNITSLLISHPSGAAEGGKASLDQQFSAYGSKQQLAIIDCHIGVKRDSKDRVCVYNRKTRRADWIPKNRPLQLTKGTPGAYEACDETNLRLWAMESPKALPLPETVVTLMRQLPTTLEPWRKPEDVTYKRFTRAFEGWLHPFGLLERETLEHEPGKPHVYTWTTRGYRERTKL